MTATTATGQQNRPDMTFVIVIHQALRVDAGRLAAAVAALGPGDRPGRVAGIAAFYGQYRDQLALHHRHEDELFFPALAARVGTDAMHLDELTAQHEALDAALAAVSDRLGALADPAGDFAADQAGAASALSAMTGRSPPTSPWKNSTHCRCTNRRYRSRSTSGSRPGPAKTRREPWPGS